MVNLVQIQKHLEVKINPLGVFTSRGVIMDEYDQTMLELLKSYRQRQQKLCEFDYSTTGVSWQEAAILDYELREWKDDKEGD